MSMLRLGVSMILAGACLLSMVILLDLTEPATLTGAYMVMTFGMGPLFAVAPSRALRSIDGQAGTASAMLSGIEQTMAGIAAVLISILHDGTARPMALVTLGLAALLIVLFQRSRREDQIRITCLP